ncbi:MAG: DUF6359 domain-containing protein [Prevotellaceae bacterium]|nr:DUF6359 domain-containing protein [Prevotellaceae bacterium]
MNFLSNLLVSTALLLSFNACNNTDDPKPNGGGDGDEVVIYNEDFGATATASPWPAAASFDGYKKAGAGAAAVTYAAEGGNVTIRSNQPSSGYTDASGVNNAMMAAVGASFIINDIATCGATSLKLSFGSIVVADTLAVSYKINGTTTWTPIAYTKEKSGWGLVENLAITLPTGTNTIKLKFTAAKTTYGTRIDDVKITTTNVVGSPVITPDDNGGGETGSGDGSEANPYNVLAAQANQNEQSAWVKGYIVGGIIDDNNTTTTIDGPEDVIFGVNVRATAVLIADSKTETDYTKCVAVNLPTGAIRSAVNLKDNPTNLGKELQVAGILKAYFGIAGVRELTNHKLEGGTTPVDPDAILNETLLTQASYDKFTGVNVEGAQVWTFSAQYGAVMSGYADNASHANEDWFISPAINLAGKSNVVLTFDHARGPAGSMSVATSNYTLWISTDYTSGEPSSATWTQLTIPTHGTTAWGYVSSGDIAIPADKLTATTRIAFKYVCDNTESATWEVKNVTVK